MLPAAPCGRSLNFYDGAPRAICRVDRVRFDNHPLDSGKHPSSCYFCAPDTKFSNSRFKQGRGKLVSSIPIKTDGFSKYLERKKRPVVVYFRVFSVSN